MNRAISKVEQEALLIYHNMHYATAGGLHLEPERCGMPDSIQRLLNIMARLRDPQQGCPWDLQQTFDTIAPHTIEEAYEVNDAISHGDLNGLRDELGDLLFQVVFHSRLAEEHGAFRFTDVVMAISDKMVRRHPHVFGDTKVHSAAEQTLAWERYKSAERGPDKSALDGIARTLPALTRAMKLQRRAALVGFDWVDATGALEKVCEESEELKSAIQDDADTDRIEDEVGDLIFTCVNVARKLALEPESALRKDNDKFERRFRCIEALLAAGGGRMQDISIDKMESLWQQAKAEER
jgi:MazG family protein